MVYSKDSKRLLLLLNLNKSSKTLSENLEKLLEFSTLYPVEYYSSRNITQICSFCKIKFCHIKVKPVFLKQIKSKHDSLHLRRGGIWGYTVKIGTALKYRSTGTRNYKEALRFYLEARQQETPNYENYKIELSSNIKYRSPENRYNYIFCSNECKDAGTIIFKKQKGRLQAEWETIKESRKLLRMARKLLKMNQDA